MKKNTRQGLPPDLQVGAYTVIEPGVRIGRGCVLGHHVVLHRGTVLGNGVRIEDFSVVGRRPVGTAHSRTKPPREETERTVVDSGTVMGSYVAVYSGARIGKETLVGDGAVIREGSVIGAGAVVGCRVTVENRCRVGDRTRLETGAYLCAYSQVAEDCFVAPYAVTTNDNLLGLPLPKTLDGAHLEKGARLGAGAVLLPGRTLRENAAAGAGAVITQNIPAGQLHVGCPARYLRDFPPPRPLGPRQEG